MIKSWPIVTYAKFRGKQLFYSRQLVAFQKRTTRKEGQEIIQVSTSEWPGQTTVEEEQTHMPFTIPTKKPQCPRQSLRRNRAQDEYTLTVNKYPIIVIHLIRSRTSRNSKTLTREVTEALPGVGCTISKTIKCELRTTTRDDGFRLCITSLANA